MNKKVYISLFVLLILLVSCGSNNLIILIPPQLKKESIQYYSLKAILTTTSDWTQFEIVNATSPIFITNSRRILKGENAEGLSVSDFYFFIGKKSNDTTEVQVEYEIGIIDIFENDVNIRVTKGDLGSTTLELYNMNSGTADLIYSFTNDKDIPDSFDNPMEFKVNSLLIKQNGPLTIDISQMGYGKLALAFYYPWYGSPDGPTGEWVHWNPKNHYDSTNTPQLGYYDSNSTEILTKHIEFAKKAKLNGFIVSWWGQNGYEDNVLKKLIPIAEKNNFLFTIYYEAADSTDQIVNDFAYILQNYSQSPSFLKLNNKPVIFVYGTVAGKFSSKEEWQYVKEKLSEQGFYPFIIGDTIKKTLSVDAFDGVHTYNPVSWPIERIERRYKQARLATAIKGKLFAATVLPGYDDTIIRKPGLKVDRNNGNYYKSIWEAALSSTPNWILVCSFNEWHEGSEIEPSLEYSDFYLNLTAQYIEYFKK